MNWIIPIVGHPSAGKSTLIRYLTGVKVPVGKKPGTTKKIKDFLLSENLIIRDYPGFGKIAGRSRSYSEKVQQLIVDDIESFENNLLVGIIISDLSNVALMSIKFKQKGFIPIDYEMVEFIKEKSRYYQPIVLGNKIDKLSKDINPDNFLEYFPAEISFFPVGLKYKVDLEPFYYHLQSIIDAKLPNDFKLHEKWWKP